MTTVDRRGESEESGDDETRRRSINGDVDPNQPADTGESSLLRHLDLKIRGSVQYQTVWFQHHQSEVSHSNTSIKMTTFLMNELLGYIYIYFVLIPYLLCKGCNCMSDPPLLLLKVKKSLRLTWTP